MANIMLSDSKFLPAKLVQFRSLRSNCTEKKAPKYIQDNRLINVQQRKLANIIQRKEPANISVEPYTIYNHGTCVNSFGSKSIPDPPAWFTLNNDWRLSLHVALCHIAKTIKKTAITLPVYLHLYKTFAPLNFLEWHYWWEAKEWIEDQRAICMKFYQYVPDEVRRNFGHDYLYQTVCNRNKILFEQLVNNRNRNGKMILLDYFLAHCNPCENMVNQILQELINHVKINYRGAWDSYCSRENGDIETNNKQAAVLIEELRQTQNVEGYRINEDMVDNMNEDVLFEQGVKKLWRFRINTYMAYYKESDGLYGLYYDDEYGNRVSLDSYAVNLPEDSSE